MLNTQINLDHINQDHKVAGSSFGVIDFDGLDLMSSCPSGGPGIGIQEAPIFDLNNIDLGEYESSIYNGGGVFSQKYGNKTITFTLFIQGTNYDDLINRIDSLKDKTGGVEKDLIIKVKGMNSKEQFRAYKATLKNLRIPNFGRNDDFVPDIQADFLITSGVWEDKEQKINFFPNKTTEFENLVFNDGNYDAFPEIIFVCKPIGNTITSINIELKSIGETSGVSVSINQEITNNDFVKFDFKNKIVTINGQEVPFFGFFAPMEKGKYNVFNVSFGSEDGVNLDCYINYNPTYL